MNSLTLLDSFLSRSLSATRPPSPPDTPHASSSSSSSSSNRRRSRPPSTTPLDHPEQAEGGRDDRSEDDRRRARSASMPRRASDYALQTSRNRIKRSDRMALGLAMTSAVVGDDDTDQRESDEDRDKRRRRSKRRQEKKRAAHYDDDDPSSDGRYTHGKYYSEGQSSTRHLLRRADSSPADASARWGSSLWGLGSWLDLPATSATAGTSRQPRRRKRSSTKGSKDWDYPPGDRLDDGEERAASSKADTSSSDDSDSSSTGSGSGSGSGSSTSSSQGGNDAYSRGTGPELSGRLLFANRIFTPFHHPSLTASVPNLPSEVRVGAVGTAGLGGMEDVDTVDFEGGESDSDDDEQQRVVGAPEQDIQPQQEPAHPAPATPTRSGAAKRSATVTPIVTPKASESSPSSSIHDYFGPRAVHQERKRQKREAIVADDDEAHTDRPVVTAPDSKMDLDAQGLTASDAPVGSQEKPDIAAASTSTTTTHTDSITPHDDPPPYKDATRESAAKAGVEADSPPTPTPPPRKAPAVKANWMRRVLSFLRRAILTLLMAPVEAITFVRRVGRGKRRRQLVQVRIDVAQPRDAPTKPSTSTASDSDDENGNDDDVVTEEQAQQRAEERAARRKEWEMAGAGEKKAASDDAHTGAAASSDEKQTHPSPPLDRKQSRLLPNPHPVDPMLVHDKRAKKVTGELPAELVRSRERGGSLGLMDKKTAEALVGRGDARGEKSEGGTPLGATSPSSPAPGPRSAVIHHTPKILVLDLDETLIHSTSRSPTWTALRAQHSRTEAAKHAVSTGGSLLGLEGLGGLLGLTGSSQGRSVRPHMVEVVLGGRSVIYHVYKRPWVDYFLRKVSAWYHVVVFTASVQEYADPVIDWLDQGRGLIAGRLFRDACTYKNGSYLKNLSIVDVDLSRVCLVDNSPASYYLNPSNGIPIEGWTHDPDDEALLDLLPILDSLRFAQDVRHVLGLRITERR